MAVPGFTATSTIIPASLESDALAKWIAEHLSEGSIDDFWDEPWEDWVYEEARAAALDDMYAAAIELGELVLVIGAGVVIGTGLGLGWEWIWTPSTPTTSLPQGCKTTSTPPIKGTITKCYWGCERSLAKTINDAEEICNSLTGYCSGTCPDGKPCKPTAITNPRENQGYCWTGLVPGCETTVDYTCVCGCG
jgi:hypothetical protein